MTTPVSTEATAENSGDVASGQPWWRSQSVVAGLLLFLFSVGQRPMSVLYADAWSYREASTALVEGDSLVARGMLGIRGILTPFVYAPTALADKVVPGLGSSAVLIENSVFVALIGALILPRIVGALGVRSAWSTWICVGLTWLVCARFTPYPLMDIPAVGLFLCVVLFLAKRSATGVALAGLCAGLALNLRPAYMLPLAAVSLALFARTPLRSLLFVPGLAVGLAPQILFNLRHDWGWTPLPPGTAGLVNLQAGVAPYVVRYDTVLIDTAPHQQFYCDPRMAGLIGDQKISSTTDLAQALLSNLPWSAQFLLEKFSASLAWPLSTPYSALPNDESFGLTIPIAAIVMVGALTLGLMLVRGGRSGLRGYPLILLCALLGASAAVGTSATETRFALPIIMVAVAGVAGAPTVFARTADGRRVWPWFLAMAAGVVIIYGCAMHGLSHPSPHGSPVVINTTVCVDAVPVKGNQN
ncbi:hypothetical protein [Longispora urticae]